MIHDVNKCIAKFNRECKKSNPLIDYVRFELANIQKFSSIGKKEPKSKTGQKCYVGYKNKKKEKVTYMTHKFCPFCGTEFEPKP